jgi:hypothetical protein
MSFKTSLGFGTALTAMAAAVSVQAADLPSKKAAPVSYVQTCPVSGDNFFTIPGTQTCLRIGGQVRAEYRYFETLWDAPGNGRNQHAIGFRALGRLNVDARTRTDAGLLRTFFRYNVLGDTGNYGAGTKLGLDKAFIQWAGVTAGRAGSFFDFYANDLSYSAVAGSDNGSVNLLAYTASFGAFSASLALEERTQRDSFGGNLLAAGMRMPDIVAALRYDNEKGVLSAAQLSVAAHEVRVRNRDLLGNFIDTEYGYAIQGGVKLNLPMIAAGDVLWLQAAYSEGNLSYTGATNVPTSLGALGLGQSDGAVINGGIKLTKSWSAIAAFQHYWTPNVRSGVFGSFLSIDYPAQGAAVAGLTDTKVWSAGTNLIWSPVSDFEIGGEVLYTFVDPKGRINLPVGSRGDEDAWEGRLRIVRSF